jgi:hypothetical protein
MGLRFNPHRIEKLKLNGEPENILMTEWLFDIMANRPWSSFPCVLGFDHIKAFPHD